MAMNPAEALAVLNDAFPHAAWCAKQREALATLSAHLAKPAPSTRLYTPESVRGPRGFLCANCGNLRQDHYSGPTCKPGEYHCHKHTVPPWSPEAVAAAANPPPVAPLQARLTELEQRLARVAELAHDRDDDTHEWRSRRLGQCAGLAWSALAVAPVAPPSELEPKTPCGYCEKGFPIKDGVHYGTQALGMIPAQRCMAETAAECAANLRGMLARTFASDFDASRVVSRRLDCIEADRAAMFAAGAASVDAEEAERRGYERALNELDAEARRVADNCAYGRPSSSEAYCMAATLLRAKLAKGGEGV